VREFSMFAARRTFIVCVSAAIDKNHAQRTRVNERRHERKPKLLVEELWRKNRIEKKKKKKKKKEKERKKERGKIRTFHGVDSRRAGARVRELRGNRTARVRIKRALANREPAQLACRAPACAEPLNSRRAAVGRGQSITQLLFSSGLRAVHTPLTRRLPSPYET